MVVTLRPTGLRPTATQHIPAWRRIIGHGNQAILILVILIPSVATHIARLQHLGTLGGRVCRRQPPKPARRRYRALAVLSTALGAKGRNGLALAARPVVGNARGVHAERDLSGVGNRPRRQVVAWQETGVTGCERIGRHNRRLVSILLAGALLPIPRNCILARPECPQRVTAGPLDVGLAAHGWACETGEEEDG